MHKRRMEAIDHFLERYNTESVAVMEKPFQMQLKAVVQSKVQVSPPKVAPRIIVHDRVETDEFRFSSKPYKTIYWPLKKTVSKSHRASPVKAMATSTKSWMQSDDNRVSSKSGSKTVYWPLKKNISGNNNGRHVNSMQKPHEMKTSLSEKKK